MSVSGLDSAPPFTPDTGLLRSDQCQGPIDLFLSAAASFTDVSEDISREALLFRLSTTPEMRNMPISDQIRQMQESSRPLAAFLRSAVCQEFVA